MDEANTGNEQDLTKIDWLPRLSVGQLPKHQCNAKKDFCNEESSSNLSCCNKTKKPSHSYGKLIKMAINSTPEMKMTLSEIYRWISNQFEYYKNCPSSSWKNTIRHNLSVSKTFLKIPRDLDDPGIGCYWSINTSVSLIQKERSHQTKKTRRCKTGKPAVVTPFNHSSHQLAKFDSNLPTDYRSNSLLCCSWHSNHPQPTANCNTCLSSQNLVEEDLDLDFLLNQAIRYHQS